jgi:hypothetical protein
MERHAMLRGPTPVEPNANQHGTTIALRTRIGARNERYGRNG